MQDELIALTGVADHKIYCTSLEKFERSSLWENRRYAIQCKFTTMYVKDDFPIDYERIERFLGIDFLTKQQANAITERRSYKSTT